MEQDKILKDLLQKGKETASPDFTAAVMVKVQALATRPFNYEPLVSPYIKRIFMISFCTVVALILIVCLLIAASNIHFIQSIKLPYISAINYQKIVTGILLFWLIYVLNVLVQKSKWHLS